jgi:hypothetical protein
MRKGFGCTFEKKIGFNPIYLDYFFCWLFLLGYLSKSYRKNLIFWVILGFIGIFWGFFLIFLGYFTIFGIILDFWYYIGFLVLHDRFFSSVFPLVIPLENIIMWYQYCQIFGLDSARRPLDFHKIFARFRYYDVIVSDGVKAFKNLLEPSRTF